MNPFKNPEAREKYDNFKRLKKKHDELVDAINVDSDDNLFLKLSDALKSAVVVGNQAMMLLGEIIEMDGAFDGMSDAQVSAIKDYHAELVETRGSFNSSFLKLEEDIEDHRSIMKWALNNPIRRWFVIRHLKKPDCEPRYKRFVIDVMKEQIKELENA